MPLGPEEPGQAATFTRIFPGASFFPDSYSRSAIAARPFPGLKVADLRLIGRYA
jgi:hypothetical protein